MSQVPIDLFTVQTEYMPYMKCSNEIDIFNKGEILTTPPLPFPTSSGCRERERIYIQVDTQSQLICVWIVAYSPTPHTHTLYQTLGRQTSSIYVHCTNQGKWKGVLWDF